MSENAYAYDVTVDDFREKVIDASFQVPVVIDFWAEWCAPCRALKPLLEKLAAEYGGRFLLARINSDENQPLAAEFGVRSIPAVKVVARGQLIDEFVGVQPEAKLREFIDHLLPSPSEPLRAQAAALRQEGDLEGAAHLLTQAMAADPRIEAARLDLAEILLSLGKTDGAARLLEDGFDWKERTRLEALRATLSVATQAAAGESSASLRQKLDAAPDDLDLRLRFAHALAHERRFREALDQSLEIVRRNRHWNDQAGRRTMLTLFNLLAADAAEEELIREYRVALARTLN